MGTSHRGRDEGDPGSQGTTRQNQQADGRLPPQRIQDVGRVLRYVWREWKDYFYCCYWFVKVVVT